MEGLEIQSTLFGDFNESCFEEDISHRKYSGSRSAETSAVSSFEVFA